MIIETERLTLREMTENDFEALNKVLADSENMRHYPYEFDENRVRIWIARNIERYRIFGFGLWAVCLKETGEMIGDCGLTMQLIDGDIKPEIGYVQINKETALPRKPQLRSETGHSITHRSTSFILI